MSNCDQRGKGFTEKETYVGHINMHLETFKCQYCGATNQNQYILLAQFVGDMLSLASASSGLWENIHKFK